MTECCDSMYITATNTTIKLPLTNHHCFTKSKTHHLSVIRAQHRTTILCRLYSVTFHAALAVVGAVVDAVVTSLLSWRHFSIHSQIGIILSGVSLLLLALLTVSCCSCDVASCRTWAITRVCRALVVSPDSICMSAILSITVVCAVQCACIP